MHTIWKHAIGANVVQLALPRDAVVLRVEAYNGVPCLWEQHAIATQDDVVMRTFVIVGTGVSFDPVGLAHVGTVMLDMWVWHIYERSS